MNKVLVVSVHPDDETLGCGGTLLKYKKNGDEVYWLIVTGVTSLKGSFPNDWVLKRSKELRAVAEIYKFDGVFELDEPTTMLDTLPVGELIGKISKVFEEIKPNIIYLPFRNDVHSDHRIVFEAAYSCTKTFRYPFIEKIYMMEVLSETEFAPATQDSAFVPNVFIDITDFIYKKMELLRLYESEIGEHPFPRSEKNVMALATLRGAMMGCDYAESFVLLKEIVRK